MSKIDELLKNEKVEWKKLGDICEDKFWIMPSTPKFSNDFKIPYITGKNIKNGEIDFDNVKYISEEDYVSFNKNRSIIKDDILISMIGTIGEIGVVKENNKFYGQNLYLLRLNPNIILTRYFYHFFSQNRIKDRLVSKKNNSSQGYIRAGNIENLEIPIPSIETQEKIVKTLDKFTNYVTELQAELQARTNQYQYYRDMLLSEESLTKISEQLFVEANNSIHYEKISNLCLRQKGINITAKEMKELDKENGAVKIFAGGNTVARVDVEDIGEEHIINKHSVIVKSRGNIDFEYYDNPFSHKNEMWSYSTLNDNILNIKFLYYVLKSNLKYFLDNSISGKLPQISIGITDNYKIPVPSIEIQNKVVEILDKFQSLLADTKGLLPQEIELRQKQYEYYREKLLTFEPKCVERERESISL